MLVRRGQSLATHREDLADAAGVCVGGCVGVSVRACALAALHFQPVFANICGCVCAPVALDTK